MRNTNQIYYRGSLKFCNYSCSYCPFSKNKYSERQIEKDRKEFFRFVEKLEQDEFHGAVQIVPYGEALVHEYYWEGLARLSRCAHIAAVGAQSNFRFPLEHMLRVFEKCGGQRGKLRLWGTFHPEMISVNAFLEQCRHIQKEHILFCVGAVGVPEQLELIQALRKELDERSYLWINKMDGLARPYTKEERQAFLELDEYFELELRHHRSGAEQCTGAVMVKGDGSIFPCNLCHTSMGNLYVDGLERVNQRKCSKKECNCYISYCNRDDMPELVFFRPYPAFRIPAYKKAVFFDVDGTLVSEGEKKISEKNMVWLRRLAMHCDIFLATSLPYEEAIRKLSSAADLIKGGVFAGGGRVRVGKFDEIHPMNTEWLDEVNKWKEIYGFRVRAYAKKDLVYKVTLTFEKRNYMEDGVAKIAEILKSEQAEDTLFQIVMEQNRMQILAAGTGKLEGIREICEKISVTFDEIAVFGNDEADIPMLSAVPFSVAVPGSSEKVRNAADKERE